MLRIIAGEYGGRRIEAPKGQNTRPTAERVREALFNVLQTYIADAKVLDLFAGSGALGFEALSRGAESVTFVEQNRDAYSILLGNAGLLRCEERSRFINSECMVALRGFSSERFDIVFLDPPYGLIPEMLPGLLASLNRVCDEDALVILEHSRGVEVRFSDGWRLYDERRYGDVMLSFMRRE